MRSSESRAGAGSPRHRTYELATSRDMSRTKPGVRMRSRWTLEQKVRILAEGSKLTGEELTAFLEREHVRLAEYEHWRISLEEGGRAAALTTRRIRELERGELERELARKEKALAEAAALLMLKKKWRTCTRRTRTKARTTRTRSRPRSNRRSPSVGRAASVGLSRHRNLGSHNRALANGSRRRRWSTTACAPAQCADADRGGAGREGAKRTAITTVASSIGSLCSTLLRWS